MPATATANRKDDVEFILEMVSREASGEYAWNTDGGRETRTLPSYPTEERVWGWSTCYDKYGDEARHYTVARYEGAFGITYDHWSSGRKWGTGKVWAYSPYVDYDDVASVVKARVYYGL